MKALLVMVHGSPIEESNDDVRKVVEVIRSRKTYPLVEIGYLDVNQPTIPESVDLCVRAGATEIVAVPYFLHAGRHVYVDLPELLEEAAQKYSTVSITMGDYLGRDPILATLLVDRAASARSFSPPR